ncbi:MAG: glycoside hydrolase family 130 protein, partial [Candidatus Eremiobacterota bacterium]
RAQARAMNEIPAATRQEPLPDWLPGPWTKYDQPILSPRPGRFDSRNVYNMATVREDGVTRMIFRGEDASEPPAAITGRLGLAESRDGIVFQREEQPVFVPQEPYESRGVEDPRLVKLAGTYWMTYTAYDGQVARLCLASSPDLRAWQRHGVLFPEFPEFNHWTKSGALLPQQVDGRWVMYFGDSQIWLATSSDLVGWSYHGEPVMRTRPGRFDSRLIEPGPPPIWTDQGILLIYNCADETNRYSTAAALFAHDDPRHLIARLEHPFLEPTLPWEIEGYVPNVVFAEGLCRQDGRWLLYYGDADRCVGVAWA